MHISKIFKNNVVIILLLISGITGGIFFLPLHLDNEYTCLYHRIFNHERPVHHHGPDTNLSKSEIEQQPQGGIEQEMHHYGQDLLDMYLINYALFWWGSLGLTAYGLNRLRGLYHSGKQKLS